VGGHAHRGHVSPDHPTSIVPVTRPDRQSGQGSGYRFGRSGASEARVQGLGLQGKQGEDALLASQSDTAEAAFHEGLRQARLTRLMNDKPFARAFARAHVGIDP